MVKTLDKTNIMNKVMVFFGQMIDQSNEKEKTLTLFMISVKAIIFTIEL